MRLTLSFFLLVNFIFFTSCSSEEEHTPWVEGSWELTEWNLDFEVDLNEDGIKNFNLLNEIDCSNSEVIKFDSNKIFTSIITHQPKIIGIASAEIDTLFFTVECSEGSIGVTGLHYNQNDTLIKVDENDDIVYVRKENILLKHDFNIIKVYNKDLTEIISTLGTTKVFRKID